MARRTRDELLAELRRLGTLHDAWRDYRMTHGPPEVRDRVGLSVRSSKDHISAALGLGGPRLSELIAGFRQAVNDVNEQVGHALEVGQPEGRGFLDFYRDRTGRDWWADAGDPARMAGAILERGRIRDETEWYLLEGVLSNVDQKAFSTAEIERLKALRRRFEDKVRLGRDCAPEGESDPAP